MLYVMSYNDEMKIGKEWVSLGLYLTYGLTPNNSPRVEEYKVHTFKDLQTFAETIYGLKNEESFFIKRPYVEVFSGLSSWKISEWSFNRHGAYEFRRTWKSFNPTMNWLLENLSADDFTEYAKDRGWNNIVVAR